LVNQAFTNNKAMSTTLHFTKMQGAGNDFVMLDGIRQQINLGKAQWRWLADRRFGIGADQMLLVESPRSSDVDFNYRIFNADGGEVEHCGNGARCFAVFVHDEGLTQKSEIRVQIQPGILVLKRLADGQVTVDMGPPKFGPELVAFDTTGLFASEAGKIKRWHLETSMGVAQLALVSMGNPHAVQIVDDVQAAPVLTEGPLIEKHKRFAHGVNVGYLQLIDRNRAKIRVFERGSGETLACGTGICAAATTAMAQGLADSPLKVSATGGDLTIAWDFSGPLGFAAPVMMTGPATRVFSGTVDVPDFE
jgi:diaminopimelate epimerase